MSEILAWILVALLWLELSVLLAMVFGLTMRFNELLDLLERQERDREFRR